MANVILVHFYVTTFKPYHLTVFDLFVSQHNIAIPNIHYVLFQVQSFKECDQAFLKNLALKVKNIIFSSGEKIINQGDEGQAVYLIKHGFCKVCSLSVV